MDFSYPKHVVFVRHAESEGNVLGNDKKIALGKCTTTYSITERGRQQSEITGCWLRDHFSRPDSIYCSYYTRTKQTAEICYPGVARSEDMLLAEANRGIWHIRTEEQICAEMPWEIDRRTWEGFYHYRPLGGESWPDIEQRVRSFKSQLRTGRHKDTVVIFGHGNWHLLFQKVFHGWDVDEVLKRYENSRVVENASVSIYHGRYSSETGSPRLEHDPETDYIIPWQDKL